MIGIIKLKIQKKGINQKIDKLAKMALKRTKPAQPNLRRIPARIMEPKVGASTWAIGSQ